MKDLVAADTPAPLAPRRLTRSLALLALTVVYTSLAGCIVAIGNDGYASGPEGERWYVDEHGMTDLVGSNKDIELGMTRREALSLYPDRLSTLMSAATIDGRHIEEFRIQAYEGKPKKVTSTFRRWLYFVDGELVRISSEKIDYTQPGAVEGW